jgi:hypothetical protein
LAVCLNISTVINIKILTNSNQQTQSYKFTSHIAAYLSVVLITEMLEICIQTSYDQNVQLILKELSPCSVWYPLKQLKKLKLKNMSCMYCSVSSLYHPSLTHNPYFNYHHQISVHNSKNHVVYM